MCNTVFHYCSAGGSITAMWKVKNIDCQCITSQTSQTSGDPQTGAKHPNELLGVIWRFLNLLPESSGAKAGVVVVHPFLNSLV